MFTSNCKDKTVEEKSKWNTVFSEIVHDTLKPNLTGTEKRHRHHKCMGRYYGFGIISKYAVQDKLSVAAFSHNNVNNQDAADIIKVLNQDICYMIHRQHSALPLSLYCCFGLTSSMIDFVHQYKEKCSHLLSTINENKCHPDFLSMSNFICENAETQEFHQEFDSTYTFISVPYWSKNSFVPKRRKETHDVSREDSMKSKQQMKQIEKGKANFIFRWTSKHADDNAHRYFPVFMSEGVSIMFSGFGCYHRQCRTNKAKFWNFASYQNRQFYLKMRKSVIRCIVPDTSE